MSAEPLSWINNALIHYPRFNQLHQGDSGEGLADGTDLKQRIQFQRFADFQVGIAIGRNKQRGVTVGQRQRQPGYLIFPHLLRDELV